MSTSEQNTKTGKIPLWFIVLFSTVLVFTLSSAGVFVFNQTQANPEFKEQQSKLESQKQLILLQTDVINTNWLRTLNPLVKEVQGRLIWSSKLQQGIMEFSKLPELGENQQYRLWIYDLLAKNTKPVSAAVFKYKGVSSEIFLRSFKTETTIKSPFKFELVLEKEGEVGGQPLLLAQP